MFDLTTAGKLFIVVGVIFLVLGGMFLLANRVPWIGQLPGDIAYESENVKVYVPITTMLIISLILTLILNLLAG